MKEFKLGILMLVVLTGMSTSHAADKGKGGWVKLKEAHVFIKPPSKKWWVKKDVYGVPLMLMSPMKKKGRYTLSIVPTVPQKLKFDPKKLKEQQPVYRSGRNSWLANFNGKALEWFPYKKEKWKHAEEVHRIGFKYDIGGVAYVENSFYALCKGQLFILKTLYREKEFSKEAPKYEQMVKNFNCKPIIAKK